MKRLIVSLLVVLISSSANSKNKSIFVGPPAPAPKMFVVAIIDTGIDEELLKTDTFCKEGHKDFTNTGIADRHGHGTHISGLIDQYARNYIFSPNKDPKPLYDIKLNYCQIVLKFFNTNDSSVNHLDNTRKALRYAIDMKVDMINYSAGGTESDSKERELVIEALNKGIKVVVAAGNEGSDIDKNKYYPAMYDSRIYRVGNLSSIAPRAIASSSNYYHS